MVTFVYISAMIMESKRQPARFGVMVTGFSLILEEQERWTPGNGLPDRHFFRQRNEKTDLPTETVGNGL